MQIDKNISHYALDYAIKCGVQNARMTYGKSIQSQCTARDNQIDNIFQSESCSLFMQLYSNGRYGEFSTNLLSKDQIKSLIDNAISTLKLIESDKYRTLPDKRLYFKGPDLDLKQYDNKYEDICPDTKKAISLNCCKEIFGSDNRIISVESSYEDMKLFSHIVDSQGFEGESLQTGFNIDTECSIIDNCGQRQVGFWYESSLFYSALKYTGCARIALDRAIAALSPRKIQSGIYNIVIENTVSSKVVAPIFRALNGALIDQQNTFLLDKLGEKVFSSNMTISDNPFLIGSQGARLFDSEGIATKKQKIVSDGVINNYYINTYYANKLGIEATIESPSVPYFEGGDGNLERILTKVDKGILITNFNGGNQNIATGDYSYGIQGFYFEKGVILFPVSELVITGDLVSLWNNLIAVGNDARDSARWLMPTLAFSEVSVSGE